MSRIIIHIGTHKTATSYIQNLFRINRRLLKQYGIIYPLINRKMGQHALVGIWNKQFLPGPGFDPVMAWKNIGKTYAKSNYTVFISSEELSRFHGSAGVSLQQLHDLVADFDEVRLIYTLRNQADFLQSIYHQIASNRIPDHPEEILKTALKTHLSQQLSLNYNQIYSQLITIFKRTEIRLISYDQAIRKKGGIAQAILDETGADIGHNQLQGSDPNNDNISAWPLAIFAACILAGSAVTTKKQVQNMQALLQETYGENTKTTIFTAAEISKLTDTFSPLNDALCKRAAFYLPDFEIGPMLNAQTPIYRDALSPEFWQSARKRFLKS